jgi:hypothetical protein
MSHAAVIAVSLENEIELIDMIKTELALHSLFFVVPPHAGHTPTVTTPIIQVSQLGTVGVYHWGMGGDPYGPIGLVYLRSAERLEGLTISD